MLINISRWPPKEEHVEDDERLESAIVREIEEETGMQLSDNMNYIAFVITYGYYKDCPYRGKNRNI